MTDTHPEEKSWVQGLFQIRYRHFDAARSVFEELFPNPDVTLEQIGEPHESAWIASQTDKGRVLVGGVAFFYKRYPAQGALYGLKHLFRRSKAMHSFRSDRAVCDAGVPTCSPLVCIEERRFGLLKRSYLFFPFASQSDNLLVLWPEMGEDERQGCLLRAAEAVGRMHRHGILHGDLNWRNILVQKDTLDVSLVDFDGCRVGVQVNREKGLEDLKHFFRDMQRSGLQATDQDEFIQLWENALEGGEE